MKKTTYLLILILVAFLPSIAFGAKGAQKCGVGPQIRKGNGLISQTLVQYTNVSLVPTNAVSVTVGTSGCGYSGIVQSDIPRLNYVRVNYQNLVEDAAKGEGVYMTGFAELMGCSKKATPVFSKTVQEKYENLIEDTTKPQSDQFYYDLKEEILTHPILSAECI
jgi:hypothetical protein